METASFDLLTVKRAATATYPALEFAGKPLNGAPGGDAISGLYLLGSSAESRDVVGSHVINVVSRGSYNDDIVLRVSLKRRAPSLA